MKEALKRAIEQIDRLSKQKKIKVISHYDADGITAAAIFSRTLQRWNKQFSLEIVKGLEASFIQQLPNDELLIFLDLASNSLDELGKKNTEVIIFDHHEVTQPIPNNVLLINPHILNHDLLSGAGVVYLFAKTLSNHNHDLATLAVIGMVGDSFEKELTKTYDSILQDAETVIKRSFLLYPSTRQLDKALEYCSNPYIPGVTGSYQGVLELLRDAKIAKRDGVYKALYELSEEEMSNLITAIMLRTKGNKKIEEMIGNLYLIKFFNKMEDAREISALINACSRMDFPNIAIGFCLGNKRCKENAEKIYREYRQHLVSALRYISEAEKIAGNKYEIINARDNIKDTIIGTITSIISHSPVYENGTIIIALAYNEDKIKVSARMVGDEGRNVREVLTKAAVAVGGEVGGHQNAAGCLISREQETSFIQELIRVLDVELVKV
jgi:single-stranded-DNA-specific exonuclease